MEEIKYERTLLDNEKSIKWKKVKDEMKKVMKGERWRENTEIKEIERWILNIKGEKIETR